MKKIVAIILVLLGMVAEAPAQSAASWEKTVRDLIEYESNLSLAQKRAFLNFTIGDKYELSEREIVPVRFRIDNKDKTVAVVYDYGEMPLPRMKEAATDMAAYFVLCWTEKDIYCNEIIAFLKRLQKNNLRLKVILRDDNGKEKTFYYDAPTLREIALDRFSRVL